MDTDMNLGCRTHAVVIILGALLSMPFYTALTFTHTHISFASNSMENLKIDAEKIVMNFEGFSRALDVVVVV